MKHLCFDGPSIVAVLPAADGSGFEVRELVSLRGLSTVECDEVCSQVSGEAEFAIGELRWQRCRARCECADCDCVACEHPSCGLTNNPFL